LHHSILTSDRAKRVVQRVQEDLFTPVGLRTLAPSDPRYIGRYQGDQRSRDAAYHQGTVWSWLMGPFVEAYIKVNEMSPAAIQQATGWLNGFSKHLRIAGLGTISEIMEGDAPHNPCGCIAQAWSVAEVLRGLKLLQPKPKNAKAKAPAKSTAVS
jgi:glycogen debranching enzyme